MIKIILISKEHTDKKNIDITIEARICMRCYYYKMIDSGYGYCKFNPPIEHSIHCIYWKWYFIPILRKVTYVDYLVVPWYLKVCSQFKWKI